MSEHLNKFSVTVEKLKEINLSVPDDMITILMLYSIPDTYDNFRCAIEARDKLPSPDALKINLLDEEHARKNSQNKPDSAGALHVGNQNNRQQQYNAKSGNFKAHNKNNNFDHEKNKNLKNKCNYKYNFCDRLGHKAADCCSKRRMHTNLLRKQKKKR